MAIDRAEVMATITAKLTEEYTKAATWSTLVTAVQSNFTPSSKQQLMSDLTSGRTQDVGSLLQTALLAVVTAQAQADATAMMADDRVDLADLLRIL